MAKGAYIGVDGVAHKVKGGYIGVDGVARKIKKAYIGVSGVAKLCWASVDPVFANNTWADIIAACQANSVPDTWVVGDQKAMTINGTSYAIDIIGKNHDTYSAGGKAPLTFQMHNSYNTSMKHQTSQTNSGGWEQSLIRTTELPKVLSKMPSEVQAAIREVNKVSGSSYSSQYSTKTTADKLFLLSQEEVTGDYSGTHYGEGSQYAYYSAGKSKIKTCNGGSSSWWLRSMTYNQSRGFRMIDSSGNASLSGSNNSSGAAFAFCF